MNFQIRIIFLIVLVSSNLGFAQMQLDWARRYTGAGSLEDGAGAVCVDDSGNVYVTGGIEIAIGYKCTTIKYNKYGDSVWVRDYQRSGNNYNLGNDIKLDDSGNVYIAGAESVIKYDKSGNLKWTAYNAADYRKLIIDSLGNIYAAGIGSGYYVVAKYGHNGNNFWVNRYPGAYKLHDLALDNSGNILITGETEYAITYYDYTTIKYSNSGNIIWIRHYNGPGPPPLADDISYALTTDKASNVYVTGASQDASSNYNCTTIKYDSSGNVIWIKRIFPPTNGYDIAVDNWQNVYIASRSSGNNYTTKLDIDGNIQWVKTYPTTDAFAVNIPVLILDSANNVYVTANIDSNLNTHYGAIKYDNNGNQIFVVTYKNDPNGFDYVYGMTIDKNGSVYLTGSSQGHMTYYDYATVKSSPIITNILESNIPPLEFILGQNYPNPFNPSTKISYSLPNTQYIILKVYDVLGNEIATLVNKKQDAGNYEIEFDGSNFASGVYFYNLEIDGRIVGTKRMVLLR